MRLSDSPTREFFSDAISRRINGQPRIDAVAFDDSDFPVPGIPTRSNPLGWGSFSLSGENALALFWINDFKFARPPTSFISVGLQNSIKPDFRII